MRLPNYRLDSADTKLFALGVLPFIEAIGDHYQNVSRLQASFVSLVIPDARDHSQGNSRRVETFDFVSAVPIPENRAVSRGENFNL